MADTPRLTIRCEYPDTDMAPTEVTFRLSPSYGLTTGHEVNEWFIDMMYQHEEFEAHLALAQYFTPSGEVELTAEQLQTLRTLGYIR